MTARASDEPVRVLLVEGGTGIRPLAFDLLARRRGFAFDRRSTFSAALEAIRRECHDVYLIPEWLGDQPGLELVRAAFSARPLAPVILLEPGGARRRTGRRSGGRDLESAALGIIERLGTADLDAAGLERSIRSAIGYHEAIGGLARSEERYALALRAANDGIWDWDLIRDTISFSPRWHALLGLPEQPADTHPHAWFDLVHPADLQAGNDAIAAHLDGRTPQLGCELRMGHADGGWRWMMVRGLAIRDVHGRPTRMAGSLTDITDRRRADRRLAHDALHDTLTGLPNRTLFMDRVAQTLRRGLRDPHTGCAILFVDVDRFKLVNDSLSHAVGDGVLMALARRMAAVLRPGDTVARLGSDEFTVLLDDISETAGAAVAADRIVRALEAPFTVDGHELFVSASIGVAASSLGMTADDLVRNADIARYDARRRGRARWAVFDEGRHRQVVHRMTRETELRHVVDCSLLGIHYQPIVELATGDICGLEALARWPADRVPVSPSEFISIAEETGVIGAIGRHVLDSALAALAGWRGDGLVSDRVCMSVNVSGRQLDDPGLAAQVRASIAAATLPPEALKLEITESTLMQELEHPQNVFSEVCDSGIGLHLDDFGTGYSSLSALARFPVDALKIDRSFVATIAAPDGGDIIVRSTVALAHSLGLAVIAEGIECRDQLRRLRALGCEFGQGYLFSPALSAGDTRELLAGWEPEGIAELGAPA
jgi:diguanylate cyclase (GGDEF)-like protein/PAS domain S-box-containing protein